MVIAIASGKGGTGKTTLAVNLARVIGSSVQLLDCDVEEPNCHLLLPEREIESQLDVTSPFPRIRKDACDGCGECSRFCQYHAIALAGLEPMVFPELCRGCGGCARVCPNQAIDEVEESIGTVEKSQVNGIQLVQGTLRIGMTLVPAVVRATQAHMQHDLPVIIDAPPGTSCGVIASVRSADCVILVAEPTVFGLHDLTLAVEMVRQLRIPLGVVINRVGMGDGRVHGYCKASRIPILTEIPEDKRIVSAATAGRMIVDVLPQYAPIFRACYERAGDLLLAPSN